MSAGLINIESNLSAHSIPPCNISKDGNEQSKYKQDVPAVQYIQHQSSTQHNESENVHEAPEHLVCRGPGDGEAREVVLMIASTQNQVSNPGLTGEEPLREALHLGEGSLASLGTSAGKDEPPSERKMLNETKYDLNSSSSQTRMFLQGSTVVFSDEPTIKYGSSQGSSHTVAEIPDGHKSTEGAAPSPRSSVQCPESNPAQPRPPLLQSMDCLPTFTSQRPPDLPTTMGKRAPSNTWNTTSYERRYV